MFYEEIKIIGIDKDRIEKDEYYRGAFFAPFENAYKFAYKLSQYPDSHWINLLYQYSIINVQFSMKRNPHVFNDCLIINVDAGEDLQKLTDEVKKIIKEINKLFKSSCKRYEIEQERKNLSPELDEMLDRLKLKAGKIKF